MASNPFQSQLVFLDRLPKAKAPVSDASSLDPSNSLVIFDRRLSKVSKEFAAWIRSFPHRYPVESGESLKSLADFPAHFGKLAQAAGLLSPKTLTVVAVGGGSVGDFAGFFASVFKRGVRLVHMPSTWLAAIDSSHGGKTALNALGAKNQIGTFYPAERVFLIRSLLSAQPEERIIDAMGELAKIALIDGRPWVRALERNAARSVSREEILWIHLRSAIESKMKIVLRDPREQTGVRQILNLGHTIGHVFEAHYGWSHGAAVAQGLFFAVGFSESTGRLPKKAAERTLNLLSALGLEREKPHRRLSAAKFKSLLLQDKKRTDASSVTFIFLNTFGKTERVAVPIDGLLVEARRQGWVGG